MKIKIEGIDKLQRELKEAQQAFEPLNGTFATLRFDPADPESVQAAIEQMEAAVDEKTSPYRHNVFVTKMAEALKDKFRQAIREHKAEVQE
jgi:DNA-binding FadR family transcriptional regulator